MSVSVAIAALALPASPADAVRLGPAWTIAGKPVGSLGLNILDVPIARLADPRARAYIVDFVKPGAMIRRRLQVHNTSQITQRIGLYAGAAAVVHDTFTGATGGQGNELSSWVHMGASSIDLPAGARRPVWVTIAVPKTASAGERYAAIWAQIAKPPTKEHTVGEINRVGIRVYLDVGPGGEPPTTFRIGQMTVVATAGTAPTVVIQVQNTGQRAVDISGSMSLSTEDGAIKAGPFRVTDGVTILPGQSGPVEVQLGNTLPGGPWQVRLTLQSGIVQRTAKATLTLPGPPPPAVPKSKLSLGLILGGGIAAAAALLIFAWSRRRQRALTRA